jgi:hypothetical protein
MASKFTGLAYDNTEMFKVQETLGMKHRILNAEKEVRRVGSR